VLNRVDLPELRAGAALTLKAKAGGGSQIVRLTAK